MGSTLIILAAILALHVVLVIVGVIIKALAVFIHKLKSGE